MTANPEQVAELKKEIAELNRKLDAVLAETPQQRLARESAAVEAQRRAEREVMVQQMRESRLADLGKRIATIEESEAFYLRAKEHCAKRRAEVVALSETRLQADEENRLRIERDELDDTLVEIEKGPQQWSQSILARLAVEWGLRPMVGQRHPLAGRPGLRRTQRALRELRAERAEVESQLAAKR